MPRNLLVDSVLHAAGCHGFPHPNLDGYDDWDKYETAHGLHSLSDDDFARQEPLIVSGDLYPETEEGLPTR